MSELIVRYVGLDVHKRVVEACFVDAKGKVVHRERFALNRRTLKLFASEVLQPTDHVALEATTNCWAVADALRPHVARVVVSNPMATKAIALAKVKTLSGLLPICSACKKIRDDQGYWSQVEGYIQEHTDARFTHSYCPECARKFLSKVEKGNPNTQ